MAAILLLSTLLFLSTIILSLSENIINIDCGASGSYVDSDSVTWVGDKGFVSTGKSFKIPGNGTNKTLRYFPSGTLNCYENIPVTSGRKTLVRTVFSYAKYDHNSALPLFIVIYDKKHAERVVLPPLNDEDQSHFRSEVIFSPAGENISVCLLGKPRSLGVPFISSIEVYGMDAGMYNDLGPDEGLILRQRLAYGAKKIIRYPLDPYGRLWFPSESDHPKISELTTSAPSIDNTDVSNKPPEIVMSKAWSADDLSLLENILPSARMLVYLALYFSEPQRLGGTHKRSFNVFLDKELLGSGPIVPVFGKATQVVKRVFLSNSAQMIFQSTNDSDLPKIINALELYSVSNFQVGFDNGGGKSDWNPDPEEPERRKSKDEKLKVLEAKTRKEAAAKVLEDSKVRGKMNLKRTRIAVGVSVPAAFVVLVSAFVAIIKKRPKKANPQSNTEPAAMPAGSGAEAEESPLFGKQLASNASQPAQDKPACA